MTSKDRIEKITNVATEWRDPDHPPRAKAVEETLDAHNRWTEQALTHTVNRWMQRITVEGVSDWLGNGSLSVGRPIGGLHPSTEPFAGLRDALAAWVLGEEYVGTVPASSPALVPGFGEAVSQRCPDLRIRFGATETVYDEAAVLLAQPVDADAVRAVQNSCDEHGISSSNRLVRSPKYSVGVVDGHESEDEMERLAEDMLLFEGQGRRRLALLWAPRDLSPDPYLQAMARFRGLFPAHPDTPGTLQMQQAFLDARDEPHAYADGLEFLVSRGEPTPRRPGHVRWIEYDELDDVETWMTEREDVVYALVARRHLHDQLSSDCILRTPGGVHAPPLDDPEGRATLAFLKDFAE